MAILLDGLEVVGASQLTVTGTTPATSSYGLVSLGNGGFSGGVGAFAGSANGTLIAGNAPTGYLGNLIDVQVNGVSKFSVDRNGDIAGGSGSTFAAPVTVTGAPPANANQGALQVGGGVFGGGANTFAGAAAGTGIAVNLVSASTADLINLQIAGAQQFRVTAAGVTTIAGATTISAGGLTVNAGGITEANAQPIIWKDTAGTSLTGVVGWSDNTFRVGWQGAPATNGHLLLFANGAEAMRINPSGGIAIGATTDPGAGKLSVNAGLIVTAGGATVTGTSSFTAAADEIVTVQSGVGNTAAFQFNDGATLKWQVGKATTNNWVVFDSVNARNALVVSPASGVTVPINGLTVTAGGLLVSAGGLTISSGGLSSLNQGLAFGASSATGVGLLVSGDHLTTTALRLIDTNAAPFANWDIGISAGGGQGLGFYNRTAGVQRMLLSDAGVLTVAAGLTVSAGGITVTGNSTISAAQTSGQTGLTISPAAVATVIAETIGTQFSAQTLTITGGYALERFVVVAQPTITAGSALTVTSAATLSVEGPPLAGGSAVITNQYGLWVRSAPIAKAAAANLIVADQAAATAFAGSANGTFLAVNSAAAFTGNLVDLQVNGVSKFSVNYQGNLSWAGTASGTITATAPFTVTGAPPANANNAAFQVGGGVFGGGAGTFAGSAAGTVFGANVAGGFTGNFVDLQIAGVSVLQAGISGSKLAAGSNTDAISSGTLQQGNTNMTSYIIKASPASGGTALSLTPANVGTVTAETFLVNSAGNTLTITAGYATQRFNLFAAPTITAGSVLTVTNAATLAISGAPTAAGSAVITNAFALWVQAGLTELDGGLTVTGTVTMATAVSRIVPGATSISLRNNANSADNLLITDAGVATVRAGLTVTAGGLTVTAGGATISAGNLVVSAGNATANELITRGDKTSGALTAFTLTAAGQQVDTTVDRFVSGSIVNNSAVSGVTLAIQISPDNVTYTQVAVVTLPATTVATLGCPWGAYVPKGWFIRASNLNNATAQAGALW